MTWTGYPLGLPHQLWILLASAAAGLLVDLAASIWRYSRLDFKVFFSKLIHSKTYDHHSTKTSLSLLSFVNKKIIHFRAVID